MLDISKPPTAACDLHGVDIAPIIRHGQGHKKGLPQSGQLSTLPLYQAAVQSSLSPRMGAEVPKAKAIFAGPFRVRIDDTLDITPTSPLRQALLAVLVLSPR